MIRSFPLCGVRVLYLAKMVYLDHQLYPTAKKRRIEKKNAVSWLSSSSSARHVLQCRCQPMPTQPIYCRGGEVLDIMHGRQRMTIDPRIPTMRCRLRRRACFFPSIVGPPLPPPFYRYPSHASGCCHALVCFSTECENSRGT